MDDLTKPIRTGPGMLAVWAGIASVFLGAKTFAQTPQPMTWSAVQLGALTLGPNAPIKANEKYDECRGVAVDEEGNSYCGGVTYGNLGEENAHPAAPNGPPGGLVCGLYGDAFVMKVSPKGEILWITQLGRNTKAIPQWDPLYASANQEFDVCNSVAVDREGGVYCGGLTLSALAEASAGGPDAFVLKLRQSDGAIVWARQLGASTQIPGINPSLTGANTAKQGEDVVNGVSVDGEGRVYAAGYTSGFLKEPNAGFRDVFLMRLRANGQVDWVTQLGTETRAPGADPLLANRSEDRCESVAVGTVGPSRRFVHCAGYTRGYLSEGNGNTNNMADAFVLRLSADTGQFLPPPSTETWLVQLGAVTYVPGAPANLDPNLFNGVCSGVAVDRRGNVYCVGSTEGTLAEPTGGYSDAFVMKLNPGGNILWSRQFGANTRVPGAPAGANQLSNFFFGVTVDSNDNVYASGFTTGVFAEAPSPGLPANTFSQNMTIVKLDRNGVPLWGRQLGATSKALVTQGTDPNFLYTQNSGDNRCLGVAVSKAGDVVCAGYTTRFISEQNGSNRYYLPNASNVDGKDPVLVRVDGQTGELVPPVRPTTTRVPPGPLPPLPLRPAKP